MLLVGKWLGNRQIRCNWGTKGAGTSTNEEKNNDTQNAVVLTNGSSGVMHFFNMLSPLCKIVVISMLISSVDVIVYPYWLSYYGISSNLP